MSELLIIPTVEQINLEHQLANSKANEAVQHATNCGLMLLQVKASLSHGEWLPWLQGTIDRKELKVGLRQSRKYMQLASNMHCEAHLLEAPSINAALELLSDKEPVEQQGELIDGEAERQARIAAEQQAESERQARELFERRAQESQVESNERRKKIRELETQVDRLKAAEPEVRIVEKKVIPADYEAFKARAVSMAEEIATLKKKQVDLVQQQVTAKLREREKEIAELDRQVRSAEALLASLNQQIDSYSSIERMTRLQRDLIEKTRSALVDLASHLEGLTPLENDPETDRLWDALADMLRNGAAAVEYFLGNAKPALTVIRGSAA